MFDIFNRAEAENFSSFRFVLLISFSSFSDIECVWTEEKNKNRNEFACPSTLPLTCDMVQFRNSFNFCNSDLKSSFLPSPKKFLFSIRRLGFKVYNASLRFVAMKRER